MSVIPRKNHGRKKKSDRFSEVFPLKDLSIITTHLFIHDLCIIGDFPIVQIC